MYYLVVATLMLAFPVLSVAVEAAHFPARVDYTLIGKWYVLESWTLVRELGFGVSAVVVQ